MDAVGSVTIGQQKAAIVEKGEVGRHEAVAAPGSGWFGVLVFSIDAGFHRGVFLPDDLALEAHLGEGLQVLVGADVEELFPAFLPDLDPVTAALELLSKAPDVASLGVEDEDRGVVLLLLPSFVDDVEEAIFVDRDVVRGLPGELIG